MTRAVCIGECMVELSARADGAYDRTFAGDAYNVAVHLKRCAPEIEVQFVTVTGDDDLSAAMRGAWRDEGIDDSLAQSMAGPLPGLYTVDTDAAGERRFAYWRGQSAAKHWLAAAERHFERLAGSDLVFMTGVSLAILAPKARPRALELIDRLRPGLGAYAFDPNVRPALWESAAAMRQICDAASGRADMLLPSVDDAGRLWGEADAKAHLRHGLDLGAGEVALTLGADGCLVAAKGKPMQRLAAAPAAVVDTAGAGDAFDGAYLAARLTGRTPEAAARAGLDLAARVVGHRGALAGAADTSHWGKAP